MKEFSLEQLGTLVHIFMSGNYSDTAQIYLNEMQDRVTAAVEGRDDKRLEEILEAPIPKVVEVEAEVPIIETPEPPRDEAGNVTRISTQVGDPGYDPDIHKNLELKILCDDVHIVAAHTADIGAGTVWYYEKNAKGRIKTLKKHGKVEIRGLK